MAILFYIQSKSNPAPIYVRVRLGRSVDAKSKTKYSVNPKNFGHGKIKLSRIPGGSSEIQKKNLQKENDDLIDLQDNLDQTRNLINKSLNSKKEHEKINSQWLSNVLTPKKKDTPRYLHDYFDNFFESKKTTLKASTVKKTKVFQSRLENYEKDNGKVFIEQVDKAFSRNMQEWCDKKKYAHNTKVKTLKVILTVCNHAKENGIPTSPELEYITKNQKYHKSEHIHLNFQELKKIIDVKLENERLDTARDWLIISCYTAQRVSDFLRFSKTNVVTMEGMSFLDISQEKTDKAVYIPLTKEVMTILEKRNGDFPPIFSKNVDSNKAMYNKLIKKVCKAAEIDELVTANMRNSDNRYELKKLPKYKAVSTHIGRRSFATNYYGKINTALLISATGHSSESQFLRYVGKDENQKALSLAKAMRQLSEMEGKKPEMKVYKNSSK